MAKEQLSAQSSDSGEISFFSRRILPAALPHNNLALVSTNPGPAAARPAAAAFGPPALLLWLRLSGRTRPLQIFGAGTTAAGALKIAERGYPGRFEASKCYPLEVVALTEGTPHAWGEATLEVAASDHARMPNSAVKITRHGASAMYSGDGRPTAGAEAPEGGISGESGPC